MKKLSILCLALTTAMSTQVFSMEIYNGKILDHKEWTTGGARATYIYNAKTKGHLRHLSNLEDENNFSDMLTSSIASDFASIGKSLEIQNGYHLSFSNQSKSKKRYRYTFSVCATDDSNLSQCAHFSNSVELNPGGYFNDSDSRPALKMNYRKPGKHFISANIDSFEGDSHRGIANSYGSILVS